MVKAKKALILVLFLAFLVRLIYPSFPPFTAEESRVAFRGYTLSTEGKDELGRNLPFLFNSNTDYQLPLTSYVTALGIKIFGKNDLGARLPFAIFGVLIVYLLYLNSKRFLNLEKFNLLAALIAAFSPTLIFLSKTPNESILLIFLFSLLFQSLTNKKINPISVSLIILFLIATSKIAWFVLLPFGVMSVYLNKEKLPKQKIFAILFTLVMLAITFYTFLLIPQSKRSLMENNFTLFSDQSIITSINRLRGQGIDSGWSQVLEKILFNKTHLGLVGFLNYMKHISLNFWFGWFDMKGINSFILSGLVSKILIFPFLYGIYLLIKADAKKLGYLFLFLITLSFPTALQYPNVNQSYLVLLTVLLTIISAFGLLNFKKQYQYSTVLFVIAEIIFLYSFLDFQVKNLNETRPIWINQVAKEISQKSKFTAVSNDIVDDFPSYYKWYTEFRPSDDFIEVIFPYKMGANIKKINFIGIKIQISKCELGYVEDLYLSKRDYQKIKNQIPEPPLKIFKDSRGNDAVYYLNNLCLQEIV